MSRIHTSDWGSGQRVGTMRQRFEDAWVDWRRAGSLPDSMLELTGVSFLADEPTIFGDVNEDYVKRELEWYDSQSFSVNDFPGGAPAIWKQVADRDGHINSNYGALMYGLGNGFQYQNVLRALDKDQTSRQAVAVYTRPTIHEDATWGGRYDFICTNTVQYLIRDYKLDVVVNMRSNDAIFGYRNDYAWQLEVQKRLWLDLQDRYPELLLGKITWQVGSLHIYPRHFHMVERFHDTGDHLGPTRKTTS